MKTKAMKRVLAAMLVGVMVLFTMSGCGQKEEDKKTQVSSEKENKPTQEQKEEKEPVTLEWYFRANGVQKDSQKVEDRVNELLKEYEGLEHVTVHINAFTKADYKDNVLLAQTAGKQIDILNTVGLTFVDEVRTETFVALDDYLATEEFADLKEEFPEWLWDFAKVEGATYMVPNYQNPASRRYLLIPKAYAKYTDIEQLREMLVDDSVSFQKVAEKLEELVVAIRKGEGLDTKYMPCIPTAAVDSDAGVYLCQDPIVNGGFVQIAGEHEIKNIYLSETTKELYGIMADWYQKGLIPSDVLVLDTNNYLKTNMKNDISMAIAIEANYGSEEHVSETLSTAYGLDLIALPCRDNYFIKSVWGAGGNGITSACEHPEEALRFLQAINTEKGKEIYNTVVYGLEDVHYKKIDDTHIETLEYASAQGGTDTSYAGIKWIIGNTFHAYLNQGCSDGLNEIALEIAADPNNEYSNLTGFYVNTESIATEIEQCNAVVSEYKDALSWGVKGKDWEAYYEEFEKKLQNAGCQKVIEEIQAQYDAWRKAQ